MYTLPLHLHKAMLADEELALETPHTWYLRHMELDPAF